MQPLAPAISNPVGLSWLKTFDVNLGWNYKIKEHLTIEPTIGIFNLSNFANFDIPASMMSGF